MCSLPRQRLSRYLLAAQEKKGPAEVLGLGVVAGVCSEKKEVLCVERAMQARGRPEMSLPSDKNLDSSLPLVVEATLA